MNDASGTLRPGKPGSFYLVTQGCKINQYEGQALVESWMRHGATQVLDPERADVIVVNSCAVTEKSLQDLRKLIRRCRRRNREADLVVTGCAAQMCIQDMTGMPEVDRIIPQEAKAGLMAWPPDCWPASKTSSGPNRQTAFPRFRLGSYPRARPGIKVQDGCSQGCTYCIVPLTRGPARSRSLREVEAEARRLLAHGHRELVLSGINLAQYRHQGMDFWDLVQGLEHRLGPDWQGRARLRLSSLDPSQLGAKALAVLAESSMLCPHLHVSMQSASPGVLRSMGRRHYDVRSVAGFFQRLNQVWSCFALGGDFLVGFPGEGEDDVQQTLDWFADQPFTYAHVFAYSPRPGTPAARAAGQIQPEVKKRRSSRLRELAQTKSRDFARRLAVDTGLEVALEGNGPGAGRCEYYVPCTFEVQPEAEVKELVPAVPVKAQGSSLVVRPGGR
jgi:MiaB/RimO family radical SAM methylthiotransferase